MIEIIGSIAVGIYSVVKDFCCVGVHLGRCGLVPFCGEYVEIFSNGCGVIPAIGATYLPRIKAVAVLVTVIAIAILIDAVVPNLGSVWTNLSPEVVAVAVGYQDSVTINVGGFPRDTGGEDENTYKKTDATVHRRLHRNGSQCTPEEQLFPGPIVNPVCNGLNICIGERRCAFRHLITVTATLCAFDFDREPTVG